MRILSNGMNLFFKILLVFLIEEFLLQLSFCQRHQHHRYQERWRSPYDNRNRNRGRGLNQGFYSRSPLFSSLNVNDWFTSLFSNDNRPTNDGTYQWSDNGNTFHFSSSSSGNNYNHEQDSTTTAMPQTTSRRPAITSQPVERPWRGQGSFTGDLRLQCFNRKCSKGIVQIYNRELKTWGTICADRWTKNESDVVCRYLQYPKGSRKALKVRKKKLNQETRELPIAFRQLNCDRENKYLIECKGQAITSQRTCDLPYYAGVICAGRKVESTETPTCTASQLLCKNRQKCIERTYLCDEMSDCPWGTDEDNCDEEETNSCSSEQFNCGSENGGCIPKTYRCDDERDCDDGRDEENCENHLSHFRRVSNRKLRLSSRRYDSGWRRVSPFMCAKLCRQAPFQCISFDYNKKLRECDLSSRSKNEIGLIYNRDYDHYEMSIDEDCTEFVCADECLPTDRVCDGNIDCPNGADEENCHNDEEDEPWELRLSGGLTSMDGRVEIRRGSGNFGLICDVGWTINEGNVVCRELGYRNGAAGVFPGLSLQSTRKKIVLSGVSCRGDETSLRQCRHDPWGRPNCTVNHEAGVICRTNAATPSPTPTRFTTIRRTIPTTPSAISTSTEPKQVSRCGRKPTTIIRPRIVNGKRAAPNEWPWQVALWIQNQQLVCGGTLIGECWVLTAAHCFTRKIPLYAYVIRLGDHRSRQEDGTEQEFSIRKLIPNNYNARTHDNDIALIKLLPRNGRCAIFNDYVQPACLPTRSNQFPPHKECKIVGWGQTQFEGPVPFENTLRHATVPLLSRLTCQTRTVYGSSLTTNMFCAGYLKGGVDTCQGDSGGPLLCEEQDQYYVWGVVSWGNGCAEPRAPGVYTKVYNYVDWIRRETGITSP